MKAFLRRIFNIKKTFHTQGFVYLDKNGEAVADEITGHLQWKDKMEIKAYSWEDAMERAFEMLHLKYPELKGKMWLF